MTINKKIKVVIIQPYNTPYRNELFNQIASFEDIDLYLVYIEELSENRKWKEQLITNFHEIQVKCKTKKKSYEENNTIINLADLIKVFYRINPDIIISQLSKYSIFLSYAFFWKNINLIHWSEGTIVTANGVNWFNLPHLRTHKKLPKAFLFPGKLAKDYHNYCGFDLTKENVFFAPNSVDKSFHINEQEFAAKFKNIETIKFLFIGSYVERKGFDILNNAFSELFKKHSNIELHVAGDGPIKQLDNAINHGFVNLEQAIELYKECHVFIMPSLLDCNPLSVIEAAKCGSILLLSDGVGNYAEMIDGNGILFKMNDVESIIQAVESIIHKSQNELIEMGNKSISLSSAISHQNTAQSFYNAIKFVMKK